MSSNQAAGNNSFDRLAAINRAITTSLNYSEVLQLVVVNAAELFAAETSLLLLAESDGYLRVKAIHGAGTIKIKDFSSRMEEAVFKELSLSLALGPKKELISTPVITNGTLSGFLAIVRESPLNREEQWQLSALADQAAIALNNARFHELVTAAAFRERDESLNALRESNKKVTRILGSITDLFYQLDRQWRFVDVNPRVEELFGRRRDQLVGHVIWEVYPEAVESPLYAGLTQAMDELAPRHFEVRSLMVPGTWFEVHAYPSYTGLAVYLNDITERKKSEQEIAFQAHLLSAVEQAVISTDLEGIVTYWNSFAESLYGWSAAEAVGRNIIEITPAEGLASKAAEVLACLRRGQSWSGEFLVRRKDGSTFPAYVTDWPLTDAGGQLVGVVGISFDITERKRAEEERARLLEAEKAARAEAERANALKDEFLATLSHELRNPLNVILGYTEILLRSEEVNRSSFLKHAIQILRRNSLSQAQLVRDLLDLSRLHMGKLSLAQEVISFETTIKNAFETVRAEAAAKKIAMKLDTPKTEALVLADPLRLEQVVWNLLNNAVKFTDPGGTVEIKLTRESGAAVLRVKDSGQGIDPVFLPNVFEMFRQADASISRKHGGMGIGLALVRQLVELQGGAVTAESAGVGQGAEFIVKIPLSRRKQSSGPLVRPLVPEVTLRDLRVLIVDDSADTIEMLHCLLVLEGAIVSCATSGREALEIARSDSFDVIISDISMPGMDGFDLLRRLREIPGRERVPILALTGFGSAADVERARAEGFFTHLSKPVDVERLLEIMRQVRSNEWEAVEIRH
jgi:PAS domain S-box-containing protein